MSIKLIPKQFFAVYPLSSWIAEFVVSKRLEMVDQATPMSEFSNILFHLPLVKPPLP